MSQRSAFIVLILSLFLFFFYPLFWLYKTKKELEVFGKEIPALWFLFVPGLNFLWEWKYSDAVAEVINKRKLTRLIFCLFQLKFIPILITGISLLTPLNELNHDRVILVRDLSLLGNAITLAFLQYLFNRAPARIDLQKNPVS
jgi:hypothetical protein